MYGNVDAALSYFVCFIEYAVKKDRLNLIQSKVDPCLFYKRNKEGRMIGVIVVYVDDCILVGEAEFISDMKTRLKKEFGVVEDGELRKLLGDRYN